MTRKRRDPIETLGMLARVLHSINQYIDAVNELIDTLDPEAITDEQMVALRRLRAAGQDINANIGEGIVQ